MYMDLLGVAKAFFDSEASNEAPESVSPDFGSPLITRHECL